MHFIYIVVEIYYIAVLFGHGVRHIHIIIV